MLSFRWLLSPRLLRLVAIGVYIVIRHCVVLYMVVCCMIAIWMKDVLLFLGRRVGLCFASLILLDLYGY